MYRFPEQTGSSDNATVSSSAIVALRQILLNNSVANQRLSAYRTATPNRRLEHVTEKIAAAETAVPVLGQGRVVGHITLKPQPTEPAISQVEVNFLAEPPLGTDTEAIADQQHADQQFGID